MACSIYSQEQNNNSNLFKSKLQYDLTIHSEVTNNFSQNKHYQLDLRENIYILQVGFDNKSKVNIISDKIDFSLYQNGRGNDNFINVNSKEVSGKVIQTGNYNSVLAIDSEPKTVFNLNILQNGNDHQFESFGSNSIGNNLKVEMTGESQTVIVRNFK
jgi:hypothetical protein